MAKAKQPEPVVLKVTGVGITFTATQVPFQIEAPEGASLYKWKFPEDDAFKVRRKRGQAHVAIVDEAPDGDHTAEVQIFWSAKPGVKPREETASIKFGVRLAAT